MAKKSLSEQMTWNLRDLKKQRMGVLPDVFKELSFQQTDRQMQIPRDGIACGVFEEWQEGHLGERGMRTSVV